MSDSDWQQQLALHTCEVVLVEPHIVHSGPPCILFRKRSCTGVGCRWPSLIGQEVAQVNMISATAHQ